MINSDDSSEDEFPDLSGDPTVVNWGTVDYIWAYCPYPECGKKNWVYMGRMDDITAPDREALRCYCCRRLSWLSKEVRDIASTNGMSLKDAFDEIGEEHPPLGG